MTKKTKKYNPSILIAIMAVFISLFSTFISLKETEILTNQQKASVWPYVENSFSLINKDSYYVIEYTAQNKGVGPAIIDYVFYYFKDKEIKNWKFHNHLQKLYPDLKIINSGNADLSKIVLSSNETFMVFKISIANKNKYNKLEFNKIVNEISNNIFLKYCYCSVHGECWSVNGINIETSEQCKLPIKIQ